MSYQNLNAHKVFYHFFHINSSECWTSMVGSSIYLFYSFSLPFFFCNAFWDRSHKCKRSQRLRFVRTKCIHVIILYDSKEMWSAILKNRIVYMVVVVTTQQRNEYSFERWHHNSSRYIAVSFALQIWWKSILQFFFCFSLFFLVLVAILLILSVQISILLMVYVAKTKIKVNAKFFHHSLSILILFVVVVVVIIRSCVRKRKYAAIASKQNNRSKRLITRVFLHCDGAF